VVMTTVSGRAEWLDPDISPSTTVETFPSVESGNPSGRWGGITSPAELIYQHKGSTYMAWRAGQ
jgi:hypothetical protein